MDPGWFVDLNIRDFDRLISLQVEESDIKCEVNVYLMGVAFDGYLTLFESQIKRVKEGVATIVTRMNGKPIVGIGYDR